MVRGLVFDYRAVRLSPMDRAMLDYAVLLTRDPHATGREGVERLLDAGFSETAVLDVCQITAYYNYVNRLADGLDVQLEPSWTEAELTLTKAEFLDRRRNRAP